MTLTNAQLRRTKDFFTLLAAVALAATVSLREARAQQPSSSEQVNTIMTHRQEMSSRAIEETSRRRFEDGKSDTRFPSDANSTKPGVVRALTPDQQKALRYNERGLELVSKGNLDGAIKAYQDAINSDPKLAAAHNNLGSAYFSAGRVEEAAAAFRSACDLDAEYGQAFFNLALVHLKLGHEKEANETLDAALGAYNSAGESHLKAGRLKEAEQAFRGMLQIDPKYTPALLRLGFVYNAAGRYEEAAQNLRAVTEGNPANATAHESLAESLYGLQRYEEAAASAERALKISADFPDALYIAGLARAALGQREAALAHLARLHQLNSPELAKQLSNFINKKAPGKS